MKERRAVGGGEVSCWEEERQTSEERRAVRVLA